MFQLICDFPEFADSVFATMLLFVGLNECHDSLR
jgi:hypothetical protein